MPRQQITRGKLNMKNLTIFNSMFFCLMTTHVFLGADTSLRAESPSIAPSIPNRMSISDFQKTTEKYSKELARIAHVLASFRKISFSAKIERSTDGGNTWRKKRIIRFFWNVTKDYAHFYSREEGTTYYHSKKGEKIIYPKSWEERNIYMNNGLISSVYRRGNGSSTNVFSSARISERILGPDDRMRWMSDVEKILQYSEFSSSSSIVSSGLLKFPIIDELIFNGKNAIRVSPPEFDSHDARIWSSSFVFDKGTGFLLEHTKHDIEITRGKTNKKVVFQIEIADYLQSNGHFFPAKLTYKKYYNSSELIRYTIDKDSLKIDEMSEKDEIILPKFPPGCFVRDDVQHITYFTPSIGNSGAEDEIAKGLKKLFDESNK
jgi:hypothetical protein